MRRRFNPHFSQTGVNIKEWGVQSPFLMCNRNRKANTHSFTKEWVFSAFLNVNSKTRGPERSSHLNYHNVTKASLPSAFFRNRITPLTRIPFSTLILIFLLFSSRMWLVHIKIRCVTNYTCNKWLDKWKIFHYFDFRWTNGGVAKPGYRAGLSSRRSRVQFPSLPKTGYSAVW